jgi:hypothetical protein
MMARVPDLQELAIFVKVGSVVPSPTPQRSCGFPRIGVRLDPAPRSSRNASKCEALYRVRQGPSWTPIHNVTSASHENRACEIARIPVLAVDGPSGALPLNPAIFFMVSGVVEYGV